MLSPALKHPWLYPLSAAFSFNSFTLRVKAGELWCMGLQVGLSTAGRVIWLPVDGNTYMPPFHVLLKLDRESSRVAVQPLLHQQTSPKLARA